MAHLPSNAFLAPGVPRFSRSKRDKKNAVWKKNKTVKAVKESGKALFKTVEVGGEKNGKTRTVPTVKPSKYYPAEDVPIPKKCRKSHKPTKLRKSITPGTVLILLAGRFRGKRVVFLKQLASGLLLVSGPFKINGVPLKRVNQRYVIATSTSIDITGLSIDEKVSDSYFKKEVTKKNKKTEEEFFGDKAEAKKEFPSEKVAIQKAVDSQLLASIKKVNGLKTYLNARFSLNKGELPHAMKF